MEAKVNVLDIVDHNGQTDVVLELSRDGKKAKTTIRVNAHPKEAEAVACAQALKDADLHLGPIEKRSKSHED